MADDGQRFRNILPYLAVAETIATRGKSPGTTALQGEQIFRDAEERKRKADEDRKAAAARELQMRLGEFQFSEAKKDSSRKDAARRAIESYINTGNVNGESLPPEMIAAGAQPEFGSKLVERVLAPASKQETPAEKRQAEQANRVEIEKLRLQDKSDSRLEKQTEKEQREAEKRAEKEQREAETKNMRILDIESKISMIDDVKNDPGLSSATGYGGTALFGSGRIALTKIDQLKDLLTFDYIQKLQSQSKTGATGLGPVSEAEFKVLKSASSRLQDRMVDDEDYVDALQEAQEALYNIKAITENPMIKNNELPFPRSYKPMGNSSSGGQLSSSSGRAPEARKIGRFVVEVE